MNGWRPVHCRQFDGEDPRAFRQRAAEIAEIVDNFRNGRYAGDVADEMEQRLDDLQDPIHALACEDA